MRHSVYHRDGDRVIKYIDPLMAGRHPFQVFMLTLSFISGLPILFGEFTAGSVESTLPPIIAYGWGASLVLGSIVALIGSYLSQAHYATAVILERMGLTITGLSAVVYAVIIALQLEPGGLLAAGIVLAYGSACLSRARDISRIIHRAIDHKPATISREGETPAETDARRTDEAD